MPPGNSHAAERVSARGPARSERAGGASRAHGSANRPERGGRVPVSGEFGKPAARHTSRAAAGEDPSGREPFRYASVAGAASPPALAPGVDGGPGSGPGADRAAAPRRGVELALFLRRWLANPRKMGAIAPSAPALARHMARAVRCGDRDGVRVVELGPGTGSVTRALLRAGIPEDRLVLIERDRHLHAWLAERFPRLTVLHSEARRLGEILPSGWAGRVSTIVSSLPLNSLARSERDEIVLAAFRVLSSEGCLIQYSYGIPPPLPYRSLGLTGERTAFAVANLPPASVWRFSRASA